MSDETDKIKDNLKGVRNIKANIAISQIKNFQERIKKGESLTYEEYRQIKEYEQDLKKCLAESLIDEKNN
jgi:hypothetical protein